MGGHPPKPRLSLSLGVIGHRPNRLPNEASDAVSADIASVLDSFLKASADARMRYGDYFSDEPPLLSLVDAIAEGADRIVADAALDRGLVLDAPLPFSVSEYENDFETEASRSHYRLLLAKARNVLELPGERAAHTQAYEQLGLTVLGLADIVVAIWDGGPPAGRGGTTAMIMAAIRGGLPIVHVDATGRQRPRVIWGGFASLSAPPDILETVPSHDLEQGIPVLVDELVRPPGESNERTNLQHYLSEGSPGRNWRIEFPLLMTLAGVRWMSISDFSPVDPNIAASRFAAESAAIGGDRSDIAEPFGWASAIGGRSAQIFRSAYVTNFVMGALAVVAAATSLLSENKVPFALAEVLLIAVIVVNTTIGRRHGWHRRWIEAREVSERLRVSTSLWSLALRPTSFQGEEPSWTGWYARAFIRQQGMRPGSLASQGLEDARLRLLGLIADQCEYNASTARRMGRLERRLERFGLTLFIATAIIALDHLIGEPVLHAVLPHSVDGGAVATMLGASLPALATASYGIRLVGDLAGIERRAERTEMALGQLKEALEKDPTELGLLRARARATANIMLGDMSSWRLAAESRALALPG